MLFTSPVFLFLFMPIMMLSYVIVPKAYRRSAILAYNALFYICANFHRPINILLMLSVILLAYIAGAVVKRNKNLRTIALFVSLMIFSLFLVRMIAQLLYIIDYSYYPLGISVYMLSAISYLIDVYRGDADMGSFFDVALYISFFPVLICGPFVKYKDFVHIASDDEMQPSTRSFSSGIIIFAFGFIKHIGISAVLAETYEKLIPIGENNYSIVLLCVIAALMFIAVYFGFSGYSDMATGLSTILGIKITGDENSFFTTVTSPSRYVSGFLKSLGSWTDDYVHRPINMFLCERDTDGKHKKYITFVSSFIRAFCICAWFKSDLKILLMIFPLALIVAVEDTFLHAGRHLRSKIVYIPVAILNFLLMSFFWAFMKDGSFDRFFYDIASSSFVGNEDQLLRMLLSLFSSKVLLSSFAAMICLTAGIGKVRLFIRNSDTVGGIILRAVTSAMILIAFFICLVIYLPQYPIYATIPFKNFAI